MIKNDFQKHLSGDIEKTLGLLNIDYSSKWVETSDEFIGSYQYYDIYSGNIIVYVYYDEAEVIDKRPDSSRVFKFDNYKGHREPEIHIGCINALKHVIATPGESARNSEFFDAPPRQFKLWSFKLPFLKRD